MSNKISIYGLSRSGKSCYIYAMAKSLARGITYEGTTLMVRTPNIQQQLFLDNGYRRMAIEGYWPSGTIETTPYDFCCLYALQPLMSFCIEDYRGGILNDISINTKEERDRLFNSFAESSAIIFFIGGDVIKDALNEDYEAIDKIQFINTLFVNYLQISDNNIVPVTLVITKSDLLSADEIRAGKTLLKKELSMLFSYGTKLSVALTHITLGSNLTKEAGDRIGGDLHINPTFGNIHIPILFNLYCLVSNLIYESQSRILGYRERINSDQISLKRERERSAIAKFFDGNEDAINNSLKTNIESLKTEEDKYNYLEKQLRHIRSTFKDGVEIYYNGELQQFKQ